MDEGVEEIHYKRVCRRDVSVQEKMYIKCDRIERICLLDEGVEEILDKRG